MTNGNANNLNLTIALNRTSTDNQLFPRTGSEFEASVNLTPPWSAFDNKDYKNLANNSQSATYSMEQQEKYRWIEYHKWKFKSKTYTALTEGAEVLRIDDPCRTRFARCLQQVQEESIRDLLCGW